MFCQVCDVTEPGSVAAAFNAAQRRFGRLDILVNCAGYVNLQPATEVTLEEWQRHLAVNLTGPFCARRNWRAVR